MTLDPKPNELCPCGSGKKFKKCCMNKKPRKWNMNVQFQKPITELGIGRLPNGTLVYFDNGIPVKDAKVSYETVYDRGKNKKVINRIELDPNSISLDPNESLKKFNFIYAIDTNTKTKEEDIISVTNIVMCIVNSEVENILDIKYKPIHNLEFWNIKDHPENLAWMKVIQYITKAEGYNPNSKIGLVVDSDLGNLPAYNSRSLPIYSDFYLPENFELIYASAEKRDDFVNHLIGICENLSKSVLTKILRNEVPSTHLEEVSNEPYTHFRFWIYPDQPY